MRCLSRMSGNLQVRFLGGGAVATSPCYPAGFGEWKQKTLPLLFLVLIEHTLLLNAVRIVYRSKLNRSLF